MKKWLIAFVTGALLMGCAGGNGGVSSTGTTGTTGTTGSTGTTGTPTRVAPTVKLPSTAAEGRILILSGQGRRAAGSQYARLSGFRFVNGVGDAAPTNFAGSSDPVGVKLDGFTANKWSFVETLPTGVTAKTFANLEMSVLRMEEEDVNGALNVLFNGNFGVPPQPANFLLATGRQTTLQVYLNDAVLFFDGSGVNPTFDQAEFNFENNIATAGDTLRTFYSDMVAFPISGLTTRPRLRNNNLADRLLVSGDGLGLAAGTNTDGSFDLYGQVFAQTGVLTNPVNLGGDIAPGTFTVLEDEPGQLPALSRITALQGAWYDYTAVLENLSDFGAIIFPTTNPNGVHQVVAFVRSGATITNLWIGRATFSGSTGSFEIWSADQIPAGTENNKIIGTLSGFTLREGIPTRGNFTVTTTPGGTTFPISGPFAVYR